MTDPPERDVQRVLAEPYAFAVLTWPAVIGMFAVADAWGGYARILLGVYLALAHLAAYGGGRGIGFGNAVLLMSGCVAMAVWMHPSLWSLAWAMLLLLALLSAQRLGWRRIIEEEASFIEPTHSDRTDRREPETERHRHV